MGRPSKGLEKRVLLALSMYPLYRYFGGPRWAWRASWQHARKVEFMNRNKQRQMLKMKREVGFHDLPSLLAAAPTPQQESAVIVWSGVVKVQYAQAGSEAYLIYNEDRSVLVEYRRSAHTRTEWNKLLERLGMYLKDFWLAKYWSDGKVEFIRRTKAEEW